MIEQAGTVARTDGRTAWVMCRPAACRACDEGRGCGAGIFARLIGGRPATVEVANRLDARPGEEVVLGLDERGLLAAASRLYGLPVLALLAGAVAGSTFAAPGPLQDLAALAGALAALAVSLHRAGSRGSFVAQPVLVRRCLGSNS